MDNLKKNYKNDLPKKKIKNSENYIKMCIKNF